MPNVEFRIRRDDLADVVSWVARRLPTKPTQAVLRAMVVDAHEGGLTVSGFDHETSARTTVNAEVSSPGKVAVAGKLLSDIVATMPNRDVEVSADDSAMVLRCGAAKFELPLVGLDEYPQLPELPEMVGEVDPSVFADAVNQVVSAVAKDDALPMLTGVHMSADGAELTLTATDRFRLAVRRVPWSPSEDSSLEALVPAKSLAETSRSLDMLVPVKLAVGGGIFGVQVGERETTSRMLDADFPNVQPLLPTRHTSVAFVDVADMLAAIKRVSLVADRNAQIRLRFTREGLVLSASGSDLGQASERVAAELHGVDVFEVAFNAGYLRDGLQVMPSERVMFGFTDAGKPAIMVPAIGGVPVFEGGSCPTPDSDFVYLIMPVRLPG